MRASSSTKRDLQPVVTLGKAVAQCKPHAQAYGACILASYESVDRNMCQKEFEKFKNCVQVKVSGSSHPCAEAARSGSHGSERSRVGNHEQADVRVDHSASRGFSWLCWAALPNSHVPAVKLTKSATSCTDEAQVVASTSSRPAAATRLEDIPGRASGSRSPRAASLARRTQSHTSPAIL